ncbi:MAG TPA: hypothetical protein VH763_15055 [Gemmatimonadales bacterium]
MIGCLTAPFKMLGCLMLVAALLAVWLFRDRIVREGQQLLGRTEQSSSVSVRPGVRALATAQSKIAALQRSRADSVVLTPSEVASLLGSGLDPQVRGDLDSLQVRLLDGEVALSARLRTARLPRNTLGPLSIMLRPTEPVEASGPVRVVSSGKGEWVVRSFRLRNLPIPADLVPRLVSGALGDHGSQGIPLRIPRGVGAIRIHPSGATLYGASRS